MNSEEFKKLYTPKESNESLVPFTEGVGFSLIRFYPKDTPYYKDGKMMFIKIALLGRGFFYSVDMTKPTERLK